MQVKEVLLRMACRPVCPEDSEHLKISNLVKNKLGDCYDAWRAGCEGVVFEIPQHRVDKIWWYFLGTGDFGYLTSRKAKMSKEQAAKLDEYVEECMKRYLDLAALINKKSEKYYRIIRAVSNFNKVLLIK